MSPRSKIPVNITNTQLLRSMARRRGIRLRTSSKGMSNASEPLDNRSHERQGRFGREQGNTSQAINPKDPEIPPPEDVMKPSVDLRRIFGIVRKYWRIRGGVRRIWFALHSKPTQEELEEQEWRKVEGERNRICKQESKRYRRLVTLAMMRSGNSNRMVKWDLVARDQNFTKIILKLDTNPKHLPPYLVVSELNRDPSWTEGLEAAIGLPVEWEVGEVGALLTIHRPEDISLREEVRREISVEDLLSDDD